MIVAVTGEGLISLTQPFRERMSNKTVRNNAKKVLLVTGVPDPLLRV